MEAVASLVVDDFVYDLVPYWGMESLRRWWLLAAEGFRHFLSFLEQ
jgi:hypothetical protein